MKQQQTIHTYTYTYINLLDLYTHTHAYICTEVKACTRTHTHTPARARYMPSHISVCTHACVLESVTVTYPRNYCLHIPFNVCNHTTIDLSQHPIILEMKTSREDAPFLRTCQVWAVVSGSFRKLVVPYFGVLRIRILLFRVLY